jgi:uncharacterized phage protein gp47/JayE
MAYTAPFIGPQGLVVSQFADIQAYLLAKYQLIYGQQSYLAADASDYQLITAFALMLNDNLQAIQLAYNGRSPAFAVGAALDGIVKCNGLSRKPASASTCQVTLTGASGTVISGGVVQDANGIQWSLPSIVTIPGGGTINVTASCQTPGNIAASIGQISIIVTQTSGWTGVTNSVAAVVGQAVEKDSQLRSRQALSVQLPSRTILGGTAARIAATANVTRYNILENDTGSTDGLGNPPHSITSVVEGGTDAEVALQIYMNKGTGALTNGTTSVTVTDPDTGAQFAIGFYRPSYQPIYVSLDVHGFTGYTSATTSAVKAALVLYLNSLQIGETVTISALYASAMSATPNLALPLFSIRALTAGTSASPVGTSDIDMLFYEVASSVTANIVITIV